MLDPTVWLDGAKPANIFPSLEWHLRTARHTHHTKVPSLLTALRGKVPLTAQCTPTWNLNRKEGIFLKKGSLNERNSY
jgi:hypothetical protein